MARLDPRLSKAILAASREDVLGATVVLTPDLGSSDGSFEEAVSRMLGRAAGQAAAAPERVTSYPALRAIAIDAPASLLRELIKSPAVESASLASQDEDYLIRPVDMESVPLEEGMRRQRKPRKKSESGTPKDKADDKKKGPQ